MNEYSQQLFDQITNALDWRHESISKRDPAVQGVMHRYLCMLYKPYGSFAIIPTSEGGEVNYGIAVYHNETLIPIAQTPFESYHEALIQAFELQPLFVLARLQHEGLMPHSKNEVN